MLDKADTNNQFPAQFKVLINKSSPGQALFRAWEFQHSRFSIVFDNLSSSQMGKIFIYLVDYKKSNPKVNGVVLNRCMVEIHKKYQNSLQKAQVEVNEAHKTSVGKQRVKLSPEQLKVQTNTKILINEKEEKSEQKQEQLDKTQIESLLTGQQEELRERLL